MFIQILDLDFFLILDPGSGGLKSIRSLIPDPNPQHCFNMYESFLLFLKVLQSTPENSFHY
jgi:hypothetical protein